MKALITENFHECLVSGFEKMGIKCTVLEDINTENVSKIIHQFEIIVINSKIIIDKHLISKGTHLKIIARIGSGLDIIDLDECKKRGITVLSSPEGNANAVAEHTLAFILSSFNNLFKSQTELLKNIWSREPNRGTELDGKTLAIIGFGHTGKQLAKILVGFDLSILVYDIEKKETDQRNVKFVSLETIFKEADIVSIHLPLTKDTYYFINNIFIEKFDKNIYLINTSRGKICDTKALIKALEKGKIKKAMLDVFEDEPFTLTKKMIELTEENKLFLSPHIAGWTEESKFKLSQIIVDKVKKTMK